MAGEGNSSWTIDSGSIIAYEMVEVDAWDDEEVTSKPTCSASYPTYESRSSPVTPNDRCKKTTYETGVDRCELKDIESLKPDSQDGF